MRKLVILRPEPGASASAERASALGLDPLLCPLFAVQPIAWSPPDPTRFDALLVTSANAVRHGGAGLGKLVELPVLAVGEATAAAARAAGFTVTAVGRAGATVFLEALPPGQKLLHLAGEDHADIDGRHDVETVNVYRAGSIAEPGLPDVSHMVLAVHSPRAGTRLAGLIADRSTITIAAISEAAAMACGTGWQAVEWAEQPSDSALLALAARLCQSPPR